MEGSEIYARWRLLKTLAKFGFVSKTSEEMLKLWKQKKFWDNGYGK